MEVYFAFNKVNGKAYVGWTKRKLRTRIKQHFNDARKGSDLYFHRAIRKYGEDAFTVISVYRGTDAEEMKQVEKNYIAGMRTTDRRFGYNMTTGGEGTPGCERLDVKERNSSEGNKRRWKGIGRKSAESGQLAAARSVSPVARNPNAFCTPESLAKGGRASAHVQHHVKKNIINPTCELCRSAEVNHDQAS